MRIFVMCPASIATGGTELLHQYCNFLTESNVENYMVYTDNSKAIPTPERFYKYNVKYVSEYVDDYDSILVLPETQIHNIVLCKKGTIMVWWLSVDNYISSYNAIGNRKDLFDLKNRNNVIHFVQSEYAKEYLKEELNIQTCNYLQDYINDEIVNNGKEQATIKSRENYVLYNPKKGYTNIAPIKEKTRPDIVWVPIINLTPTELSRLMLHSKVYIDFGNHPGKDRIPREAAICGCCIVTNMVGSAKFFEDVSIPNQYKFEKMHNEDEVLNAIYDLVDNYDERTILFEEYRQKIQSEKGQFLNQAFQSIGILTSFVESRTNEVVACEFGENGHYTQIINTMSKIVGYADNAIRKCVDISDESCMITQLLEVDYLLNLVKESVYAVIADIKK